MLNVKLVWFFLIAFSEAHLQLTTANPPEGNSLRHQTDIGDLFCSRTGNRVMHI